MKAKIDNVQKNVTCRLYGNKNETTNDIVSECCKLAKKSIIPDTTGWEVIHWELCKKVKFDHTTK